MEEIIINFLLLVKGIVITIRECYTLYVGLAHAVPLTHTNFRLTFLLAQLEEALYEDLPVSPHESGNAWKSTTIAV